MIKAFYTGQSGTKYHQLNIDFIANNVANINTIGYKSQEATFADLLYTSETGGGVKSDSAQVNLAQGVYVQTGDKFDCAINGEGYFAVMDANGDIYYTRDGNFSAQMGPDGKQYLMNSSGDYVLDENYNKIEITDENQNYTVTGPNGGLESIEVGVFTFPVPENLMQIGGNKYVATPGAGDPTLDPTAEVLSGYLESSNVDLSTEMTNLMTAQRAFQISTKIVQIADEMEQTANNLR